jgi:hypothetical protein
MRISYAADPACPGRSEAAQNSRTSLAPGRECAVLEILRTTGRDAVSRPPLATPLADRRYATVILRLQLDQEGRLIQGELVDVASGYPQRFVGWRGLTRSVRDWLRREQQSEVSDTGIVKLIAK